MGKSFVTLVVVLGLGAARTAATPVFALGSSDEGRAGETLYVLDPITGVLTPVGPVTDGSHPIELDSLAFTPGLGLYGVGDGALFQINGANGAAVEVGPLGVQLTALVFGPDGVMYGAAGNRLYSVDPSTGETTLIGSGRYGPIQSLEFDGTGALYAVVGGGGPDSLYRINPANGAGTPVGPPGAVGFDDVRGLTFVDGTMYAFTQAGLEISIDLTNGRGSFAQRVGESIEATAVDPPDTPEPATLWLAGAALGGLYSARLLRRRALGKGRDLPLQHFQGAGEKVIAGGDGDQPPWLGQALDHRLQVR